MKIVVGKRSLHFILGKYPLLDSIVMREWHSKTNKTRCTHWKCYLTLIELENLHYLSFIKHVLLQVMQDLRWCLQIKSEVVQDLVVHSKRFIVNSSYWRKRCLTLLNPSFGEWNETDPVVPDSNSSYLTVQGKVLRENAKSQEKVKTCKTMPILD